jgi:hypothetical protein
MQDYEKLGLFYLGKEYDVEHQKIRDELVLYDASDLTTHAVCVGMTGSGKTGLCISLLEEATIDGIPSIIIDPKGDMTNLLLTFPDFNPDSFKPWLNKATASVENLTLDQYAQKQSELWHKGLEKWQQSGDRLQRLKESAEYCIYTPGSTAGRPVSILSSFAVPPKTIRDDQDLFHDRIGSSVSGLLTLLGIDADPIQSREHILLSNIFSHVWSQNQDLTLALLIQSIQSPPFDKIGILDMDTFYPAKERFELAMALNNLLAAPGFQSWLSGEAFDVDRFMYTRDGKPRVSIFSIAHLDDRERMFFVSLLLNAMLGWMRSQKGSGSLRALLYIDELYGYMPPVQNPPSKKPLLTLFKQARAFGLGVMVATQNPVDLDYKGLSNIGTWFIGRLQTERDKHRLLDGLQSADAGGYGRKELEELISGLDKRVFLLHNVHENHPVIFHTRWALSYLAGPLTREQIKILSGDQPGADPSFLPEGDQSQISKEKGTEPSIPPDIKKVYLRLTDSHKEPTHMTYQPCLWASAQLHYYDARKKIDATEKLVWLVPFQNGPVPLQWPDHISLSRKHNKMTLQPVQPAFFIDPPSAALRAGNYREWEQEFKIRLNQEHRLELFKSAALGIVSQPDEDERDFIIRLDQVGREKRDQEVTLLRQKYDKKLASLESKILSAASRLQTEQEQAKQQKLNVAIHIGTTLLGAFLGRKTSRSLVSKAGTTLRSASRIQKESSDVELAEEKLLNIKQQYQELEQELQKEIEKIENELVNNRDIEQMSIRPRSVNVELVCFAWKPV